MRIAAIADLHCKIDSANAIKLMLEGVDNEADVLTLGGDLCNMGLREEMEVLLNELNRHSIPKIAVLGNHDHESDQADLLIQMMMDSGIVTLNGSAFEINGVAFVGTKGFCGGFDNLAVQPFGEKALKAFIRESIHEAEQLSQALAGVKSSRKVALMHFSPVRDTLEGEHPELYPFLGSSLLAHALDQHVVDLVLHGHAHKGSYQGKTARGTPVYNVCRFVAARMGKRPYSIFDI
jgi:hypothetical protein